MYMWDCQQFSLLRFILTEDITTNIFEKAISHSSELVLQGKLCSQENGKSAPSPCQHVKHLFTNSWDWQLFVGFQTVCTFKDKQRTYQISLFLLRND